MPSSSAPRVQSTAPSVWDALHWLRIQAHSVRAAQAALDVATAENRLEATRSLGAARAQFEILTTTPVVLALLDDLAESEQLVHRFSTLWAAAEARAGATSRPEVMDAAGHMAAPPQSETACFAAAHARPHAPSVFAPSPRGWEGGER